MRGKGVSIMSKSWLAIGLVGLGLMGCTSMQQKTADKDNDDNEVKVTLDQTPAPVQATLQRETGGAKITDLDKETDDGKTIYEADATIGDKPYEIKVADDGTLLSKKIDKDEDKDKENDKDEKKD
jgi:hypothetical protein